MATVPPFTPVPSGFVTAQQLGEQYVIEGWWLNPEPSDFDKPCSQPVYHLIADSPDEARKLVAEFVTDLAAFTRNL
ncbi:hypothetical protein [Streptomyces sp. PD-S100-1]|uniref:hypothetical protein n=1 Tax=Streptomyces sp. PD-S100-1 TaxID=3394351 RepID=UPI0039BD47C8